MSCTNLTEIQTALNLLCALHGKVNVLTRGGRKQADHVNRKQGRNVRDKTKKWKYTNMVTIHGNYTMQRAVSSY